MIGAARRHRLAVGAESHGGHRPFVDERRRRLALAAGAGVPWVVSTAASTPMETIAQTMGGAPRWYQLYWVNDREVVASLVHRAEAAGYAAIVLTLDTLQLGWRVRDLSNRYLPFILGEGIGQFTSDPVFRSRLSVSPVKRPPQVF